MSENEDEKNEKTGSNKERWKEICEETRKCPFCPKHDRENRGRRPRCDKHKNKPRGKKVKYGE